MKKLKVALILFVFGLFIFIIFSMPYRIKIRNIECSNQYGSCNSLIAGGLESILGSNLRDAKISINELMEDNLKVRSYSLRYKFPETIELYIIEKKAKYAMQSLDDPKFLLVDEDGLVISVADKTNLPFMFLDSGSVDVGSRVDDEVLFSLEVLFDAFSSYKIRRAELTDDGLVIELLQGTNVIFPREGDREVLIGSLHIIMSALTDSDSYSELENVNIRDITIDLRYKNPVIR